MNEFFLVLVIVILIHSFHIFLKNFHDVRGSFSKDLFSALFAMYFILMLGFALVYFLLAEMGVVLLDDAPLQSGDSFEKFFHAVYFSGVTLMTVGYGDITPVGIGRVIALCEAFIGYLLPATFLYKLFR